MKVCHGKKEKPAGHVQDHEAEEISVDTTAVLTIQQQQQQQQQQQAKKDHSAPDGTSQSYSLAFFIMAILAWVCTFTIMATHTEIVRDHIYPSLGGSSYFEEKAGARTLTYLVIFYLIAGVGVLAALWQGFRLPSIHPSWFRAYRLRIGRHSTEYWNHLEVIVLVFFLAVQASTMAVRIKKKFFPDWEAAVMWYEVSKTLGKTVAFTMTLLFLPVCKSCFWLDLFNCKFERAVKYHRWLCWFWVLAVLFHAATAITSLTLAGQFKNCMWPSQKCEKPGGWSTYQSFMASRTITYGWMSLLLAIPLILTSLPYIRRKHFECFYYTHFLFIPALFFMHMHFPELVYYTAPGLAAYAMDKILWWCSSRRPIRIVRLFSPVRGFVRLVLAKDKSHTYYPGQWVQLKVPAVSNWEWHPMSVAYVTESTLTIDIKALGNWTRKLEKLAVASRTSTASMPTHVFLDQFHGSRLTEFQSYLSPEHSAVLLIAGGIGITPMLSSLRMIINENCNSPICLDHVRRVVLVWVVKKLSVIDLYREELSHYQSLVRTRNGCQVDICVFATLSEKEDEAEPDLSGDVDQTEAHNDSTTGVGPFVESLTGYGHKMVLTFAAGMGYLVGLFMANSLAHDQDWRFEYVVLLQTVLAVATAAGLVAIGMSGVFFRCTPQWSPPEKDCDEEEFKNRNTEDGTPELEVTTGHRPCMEAFVYDDIAEWCRRAGHSSVGVSVCGPEALVECVARTCATVSSSDLHFVVSEETFEW